MNWLSIKKGKPKNKTDILIQYYDSSMGEKHITKGFYDLLKDSFYVIHHTLKKKWEKVNVISWKYIEKK